ncbi:MAG: lactonase family protein [Bacteriovoracia bacterium]
MIRAALLIGFLLWATGCGARFQKPVRQYQYLVTVNRGANSLSLFRVEPATGWLSFVENVSTISEPYLAVFHPRQGHLYVASSSAGGSAIRRYSLDIYTGTLTAGETTSLGDQTPSLVFNRSGTRLYASSFAGILRTYAVDGVTGALSLLQELALPSQPRQISLHPSESFLYCVGCLFNQVASYRVSESDGTLSFDASASASSVPIDIAFDSTGNFMSIALNTAATIATYGLDLNTGGIGLVSSVTRAGALNLSFSLDGAHLIETHISNDVIAIYAWDGSTASLTLQGTQTLAAGPHSTLFHPTSETVFGLFRTAQVLKGLRPDWSAPTLHEQQSVDLPAQPQWLAFGKYVVDL